MKERMMFNLPVFGLDETVRIAPSKIIALGLNYLSHIAESPSVKVRGMDEAVPTEPVLFPKTPNVLIPTGQPIILPSIIDTYGFDEPRTDYEGELALIIGSRAHAIKADDAYDYIYGYTCMNDVSQRNIQNGDRSGWFRGKSFDTFGPIGPVVVPATHMTDPHNLRLQTRLNGAIVQDANTSMMIFKIPEILAFISRNVTLEPGDIVLTGTPSGVGPIQPGDVVEVEIEGIGVLRNPVIAGAA
jgi:2-keto-4-pentenoate hydratase/2-oxohepta-3-ene-1,7-dioic acid hydratase in catechol pathway